MAIDWEKFDQHLVEVIGMAAGFGIDARVAEGKRAVVGLALASYAKAEMDLPDEAINDWIESVVDVVADSVEIRIGNIEAYQNVLDSAFDTLEGFYDQFERDFDDDDDEPEFEQDLDDLDDDDDTEPKPQNHFEYESNTALADAFRSAMFPNTKRTIH